MSIVQRPGVVAKQIVEITKVVWTPTGRTEATVTHTATKRPRHR